MAGLVPPPNNPVAAVAAAAAAVAPPVAAATVGAGMGAGGVRSLCVGGPQSPFVALPLVSPRSPIAMAIWAKKAEAEHEAFPSTTKKMRNYHHVIQGNNPDPGALVLSVSNRAS